MSFTSSIVTQTVLPPSERIKKFGLECTGPGLTDEILFKAGWIPGGEYTQKLTIRNVSGSIKKFKYKLPSSRFFSMSFPELITLSPGCFICFDVIFRPVELAVYDDSIYIKVQDSHDNGFRVPVRALLSNIVAAVPSGIDFGYCPTNQVTDMFFPIENVGEIDAPFKWDVPFPFIIEPAQGVIPVGGSVQLKVSICPVDASVYVAQATCSIGDGVTDAIIPHPLLLTKFSAIGKYAYLILSENTVDFNTVTCGEVVVREVVLQNKSVVPTEFSLVRFDSDLDEVFSIEPTSGMLPGQSELFVTVKYKALAAGCFSEDKYAFRTPGNCDAALICRATAVSPVVTLQRPDRATSNELLEMGNPTNAFNFGDSEIGRTESRIFTLVNSSSRSVSFSFVSDAGSVFKITPMSGVIRSLNEVSVKITFSPSKPINFYRRVFFLLEDCLPQFVDFMGSGYIRAKGDIKEQRPFPLRFAHVQAMRNRSVAGLGHLSADELDALFETRFENEIDDNLFAKPGQSGTQAMSVSTVRNPVTRSGESTRSAVAVAHEFFISDTDSSSREIFSNKTSLDFGFTPHTSLSDVQTVTLSNNTNAKVSVVWFIPPVDAGDDAKAPSVPVFSITPAAIDIEARKSQSFAIVFSSKQSNRNFVSEAEAIVYLKNQRTFRLVNDSTMAPPWNLPLRLTGHTFASGQLLANVRISGSAIYNGKLTFPCTYVEDAVFETIVLENRSNLPAVFKALVTWRGEHQHEGFEEDSFAVKPDAGQIAANGFLHICVRFKPTVAKTVTQTLRLEVNGDEGPHVVLEGNGATPYVILPDIGDPMPTTIPKGLQGTFYMQPTAIGLATSRSLHIQNCSRLPLRYEISLPDHAVAKKTLIISPVKGVIKGNQCAAVTVEFRPIKATRKTFKVDIQIFPIGGPSNKILDARQAGNVPRPACIQKLSLNIAAPGEVGAIVFTPSRAMTPVQLIHTNESTVITMENISDSEIYYELFCESTFIAETNTTERPPPVIETYALRMTSSNSPIGDLQSLTCNAPTGNLPARSQSKVTFTLHPERAGEFAFKVFAMLKSLATNGGATLVDNATLAEQRLAIAQASTWDTSEMPLMAVIEGCASFPKIVFEDIRVDSDCIITDKFQLWRQFALASLNYDLSAPLTEEEVRLNAAPSVSIDKLKRYFFNFTPKPHFSSGETVLIQVRNHGSLPATFHIHYPNEQELELEQWVEEEEPTSEKLKETTIIDKLKCFSISPLAGKLMPNEKCILTLKYTYDSMKFDGIHNLALKVVIDKGKKFLIELAGKTIPVDKAYNPKRSYASKTLSINNVLVVPFADQDNTCFLNPVPIGLSSFLAPEQRTELVNVSEVEVSYEVDITTMEFQVAGFSQGQHLFTIENPRGTIPGLSSVFIVWHFYPLEAVLYEFPLIIRYVPTSNVKIQEKLQEINASSSPNMKRRNSMGIAVQLSTQTFAAMGSAMITLQMKCLGFDPRQVLAPKLLPFNSDFIGGQPPVSQLLEVPTLEQPVRLSVDFIEFGRVPIGSTSYAMCILHNNVHSQIKFLIESPPNTNLVDLLTFSPKEGVIEANSHVTVNVRCFSQGAPRIFTERIRIHICEVIGDEVLSVSSTLFAKMNEKLKAGKTDFKQKHNSVIVKSTASRRLQLGSAILPEGRTATFPSSHAVEVEAFKQLNVDADMSYATSTSSPAQRRDISSSDKISVISNRSNHSPTHSISHFSLAKRSGSPPSPPKVHAPPIHGTPGSKGGLKKAGSGDYGPPSFLYLFVKGEFQYWDTIANMLVKAKATDRLSSYLVAPRSKGIPRVLSPNASSPQDILRPLSDNAVAQRIRVANKESEVRDVAEFILSDIFGSLMNPWDIGTNITDAVTTMAAGLKVDGSLAKPLTGNPIYGLYFDDVNQPELEHKFLMELHYALGTIHPQVSPPVGFLTTVEKAKIPAYWRSDEKAILADRRSNVVTRENFYMALSSIGFSHKGVVYKAIDKMIKLRGDAASPVDALQIARDIPKEYKRAFAKLVEAASLKRKKSNLTSKQSLKRQDELIEMDRQKESEILTSRESTAAVLIQSSLRADKAKLDTNLKQEKKIEMEANVALANREGFLEIMSEVLYNTMFNIIDEASFGEFPINAEPLRFAMSRDSRRREDDGSTALVDGEVVFSLV